VTVPVLCLPETRLRAEELARQLGGPVRELPDFERRTLKHLVGEFPLAVRVGEDISLQALTLPPANPVRVDWTDGRRCGACSMAGARGNAGQSLRRARRGTARHC